MVSQMIFNYYLLIACKCKLHSARDVLEVGIFQDKLLS